MADLHDGVEEPVRPPVSRHMRPLELTFFPNARSSTSSVCRCLSGYSSSFEEIAKSEGRCMCASSITASIRSRMALIQDGNGTGL